MTIASPSGVVRSDGHATRWNIRAMIGWAMVAMRSSSVKPSLSEGTSSVRRKLSSDALRRTNRSSNSLQQSTHRGAVQADCVADLLARGAAAFHRVERTQDLEAARQPPNVRVLRHAKISI
jgi:hypothetical protein